MKRAARKVGAGVAILAAFALTGVVLAYSSLWLLITALQIREALR